MTNPGPITHTHIQDGIRFEVTTARFKGDNTIVVNTVVTEVDGHDPVGRWGTIDSNVTLYVEAGV